MTKWEEFKEWLVPSEAFRNSSSKDRDLALVRFLSFAFYAAFLGFICYTVYLLLFEGRIEVIRSYVKLDVVECPSIAVCPFNPHTDIVKPPTGPWIEAELVLPEKRVKMNKTKPVDCSNLKDLNRGCVCFDLSSWKLRDHSTRRATGTESGFLTHMEVLFSERVEITTNLKDPSGEDTMEIGLYTRADRLPDWFYVRQGQYTIGNLQLATWTATDISVQGLERTLAGDKTAMAKYRLMFTFNGFQVGKRGLHRPWNQTKLSYEMKNFFVDETVSSERAYSIYGAMILIVLFLVKGAVHSLFVDAIMPAENPNKDLIVSRELSSASEWLAYLCCFEFCYTKRGDEGTEAETRPLVQ
jgi:hypothetical protein|mmetsp:Transcript_68152/g.107268  ORF Transcript_68152/g.107268 Transcript_68152/m.107268 type:complete len:355 (+) Transcript_68152:61-1125(+)